MSKRVYSLAARRRAINQVINAGMSVHQVACNIGCHNTTLYKWLKEAGHDMFNMVSKPTPNSITKPASQISLFGSKKDQPNNIFACWTCPIAGKDRQAYWRTWLLQEDGFQYVHSGNCSKGSCLNLISQLCSLQCKLRFINDTCISKALISHEHILCFVSGSLSKKSVDYSHNPRV